MNGSVTFGDELGSAERVLYRGAWEFWCKLHADKYKSARDLAMSFLAAVDLAMNTGSVSNRTRSYEFEMGNHFVPIRFALILQLVDDFPDIRLSVEGNGFAEAAAMFQNAICEKMHWELPAELASARAAQLSQTLALDTAFCMQEFGVATESSRKILKVMAADGNAGAQKNQQQYWEFLNESDIYHFKGQCAIRMMINAAVYRTRNPGYFAMPHIYADDLVRNFPLPAVLYRGAFYLDSLTSEGTHPLEVDNHFFLSECISLMAIEPFVTGNGLDKCGFIQHTTPCPYIAAGAGCPKKGLSKIESAIRTKACLEEDWCHWTLNAVLLKVAQQDLDDKWRPIWRNGFFVNFVPYSLEFLKKMREEPWTSEVLIGIHGGPGGRRTRTPRGYL